MKKHSVEYKGGESRMRPGVGVDYMLVLVDDVELYAEAEPDDTDETATYDELRSEIIAQAEAEGIDPTTLRFCYDAEEA